MLQLPLYVGEEATRADAEEVGAHPVGAKLFFHQDEPIKGLPGGAYATSGLEPYFVSCPIEVFTDSAYHYCADRQGGVGRLLACGGLDEVGTGHHADDARLVDIAQGSK